MFGAIKRITENAQKIKLNTFCVTIWKMEEVERIILSYNRIDQLTKGLNSDGEIIGVYSPITDAMSQNITFSFDGRSYEKIAGEPYNFIDSGKMFRSMTVMVMPDGFAIEGDTDKEDKDWQDYNVLGLTDENKNRLVEAILPLVQKEARRLLFD